jgi:tRNA(Ile2) C34 agmatinyltransferase TiaS
MESQYNFFQLFDENVKIEATQQVELVTEIEVCPICGEELIRNGRCKTCYDCGWSSCDL